MTYLMRITEAETGESITREYPGDYSAYWWTDGNFSCDCNRTWEFLRAKGVEEEALPDDPPCSRGKYTAELVREDREDAV